MHNKEQDVFSMRRTVTITFLGLQVQREALRILPRSPDGSGIRTELTAVNYSIKTSRANLNFPLCSLAVSLRSAVASCV